MKEDGITDIDDEDEENGKMACKGDTNAGPGTHSERNNVSIGVDLIVVSGRSFSVGESVCAIAVMMILASPFFSFVPNRPFSAPQFFGIILTKSRLVNEKALM